MNGCYLSIVGVTKVSQMLIAKLIIEIIVVLFRFSYRLTEIFRGFPKCLGAKLGD